MFHPERGQEPNQEESPSIDLQRQIDRLTKTGVHLPEIVRFLGAEEYLSNIGTAKNPVFRFDVKSFIESRSPEEETIILPDSITHTNEVILPPDEGEILSGSGKGIEKKDIIPRTARFIELLSDLNLHYSVIEGTNDPKMMRALSYRAFNIPDLKKLTFVNDEEGNATFVINDFDSETEKVNQYASLTKDQLKDLPIGRMTLVVYPGTLEEWAIAIRTALEDQKKPYEATTRTGAEEKRGQEQFAGKAQHEKAPEGWLTAFGVGNRLGLGSSTIKRAADQQREMHPNWFADYLDEANNRREHYSPELVGHIMKEITLRGEQAPEGWMTTTGLAKQLAVSEKTIKRVVDQQRKTHPEWFRPYVIDSIRPFLHYSPELVEYVIKEISAREQAPEGWLTAFGMSNKFGVDSITVKRMVDKQRSAHPEWFVEYLDKMKRPMLHYSPELVEYMAKIISAREQAPEGWVTNSRLADGLGVSEGAVKRIADGQQHEHPTWFAEYLDITKKQELHYSPELVEYITQTLSVREKAPEGWMTINGVENKTGINSATIQGIANRQRQAHPEWFADYLDETNNQREHYGPDLVEYITKEITLRGEKAPEGWMTNNSLADKLGVAERTVKRIVDQQQEHPEWFAEYLDKMNRRAVHYSPELVKYITQEIKAQRSSH
jgi:plasmid maintenance system antidote protein VapI